MINNYPNPLNAYVELLLKASDNKKRLKIIREIEVTAPHLLDDVLETLKNRRDKK